MPLSDLTTRKIDYDFIAKESIETIQQINTQMSEDNLRKDELKVILKPKILADEWDAVLGFELVEIEKRIQLNFIKLDQYKTDLLDNVLPNLSTQEYKDELQTVIDSI